MDWTDIGNEAGRLTLHEDGQITWQANKTNPLPGDVVAQITKGDSALCPAVTLDVACPMDGDDKTSLNNKVATWVQHHIAEVLAPLFALKAEDDNTLTDSAKDIGEKVYDAMGVIHRSEIETHVPSLTPELRALLRRKRVKLGPILVFMPELVKPAAINLRALLWGLWNDKSLPMERPADGRVSVAVDPQAVDKHFYRSIGYPVFGKMAIRIDMLDRVVTDIYDSSKDWKFEAQHKYMEWLGCGEEDLYAILETMGFRRVKEDVETKEKEVFSVESDVEDEKTDENTVDEGEKQSEKPQLAIFWLKKGKISDIPRKKPQNNSKNKPKKQKTKPSKQKNTAKAYSAPAKENEIDNDSPFAILQQLKSK